MRNPENFYSPYVNILIALALISGLALTLLGLSNLTWPLSIPWADEIALYKFVCFLLVTAILIGLFARWLRWKTSLAFGIMVALLAIAAGALWPLLLTLLFACASALLGHWFLGKLKIDSKNWVNNFLIGAGLYGTAIGLLAHFPVNYPGIYGFALILPLVLGWRLIVDESKNYIARINNVQGGWGAKALDVAIAALALVYFVVALMPEVGFDSLAMHLFIPAHLSLRHQWGFDANTYVWAVMPMLGDWIFSIGYMLAGETAVRLINVGFIFIIGWLVRDIVLWAGGSVIGARWAVLLILSTPLTFTEGGSLYIESIWASFAVAGTLSILIACSTTGKPRYELPVAGFLLGCALATKAVTFTLLPILLLILIWRYKTWFKTAGIRVPLFGTGMFLAIGFIPYATAWRLTGNPVFPLFNKIFKSPYFLSAENFTNPLYNSGVTWDVLYRVTFETGKYLEANAGASGFQWLLLFIPAFIALVAFKQIRGLALLLIGMVTVAVLFHSQSYLRYAFPSWIILTAAIGVALSTVHTASTLNKIAWYCAAVLTVVLNLLFFSAAAFNRDFSLRSSFDLSGRDVYLNSRLPIRNAVELVNRLNIAKNPVAVFAEPLTAGISGDALFPNWYNIKFQGEIASIQTEQQLANILLQRKVNYIILDSNWNGVNCCGGGVEKQALVEKVSEKIADYGSYSVRKIRTDYRFKTELLINPDFNSSRGWNLAPDAKFDSITGKMLVSVNSPAVQLVDIIPDMRYLNTVVARCVDEPAVGRVQINWLDSKGRFVHTNIKTFNCTRDWSEQIMEATAPPNSIKAEVYVTGHSTIPLEFKSNSLRQ